MLALKAWYCDSTHRYAMTDAVQPLIVTSARARKPAGDPKADLRRYFMLAHGSHLVDTARFLGGEIVAVRGAPSASAFGAYCWFVDVEFANGALGHLDLTVAVRMDWHEGFQLYGENGSVIAKTYNPWYYKSSEVEIFHESDGATTPRRSAPTATSTAASSRASPTPCSTARRCAAPTSTTASPRSARWSRSRARSKPGSACALADVDGAGLMQLGIFAKTFPGSDPGDRAARGARRPASPRRSTTWPAPACRPCPTRSRADAVAAVATAAAATGVGIVALSGTYNMIHPDPAGPRSAGLRRLAASSRRAAGDGHARSSRSAPAPATRTTSGAPIRTMHARRPGAICWRAWRSRSRIAEAARRRSRHRAGARQRRRSARRRRGG